MPALELNDRQSDFRIPLPGSQQFRDEENAGLEATPFITFDTEDTFLTSLDRGGRASINGIATGGHLSTLADYSNDPRTAVAEWCAQLESVVNGNQGKGYTMNEYHRNDATDGTIETVRWSVAGGEQWAVSWNIDFIKGRGSGVYVPPDPDRVSPGGNYSIDGETVDSVSEFAIEVSQPFEVFRRAFADSSEDNDLLSDAGAVRRITMTGEVVGTAGDRNFFDDWATQYLGEDRAISISEGFTGRSFTGMIDSYDATDESGRTRFHDFAFELVEGTDI